jgi:hypothetical protein
MADISPDIERQLAEMTDAEFSALTARVRAPDTMEQFRDIAKIFVPEHVLNDFMEFANPVAFVGPDGQVNEAKVRGHLSTLFGSSLPQSREWGQHHATPVGYQAGDEGRASARRRAAARGQVVGGTETPTQSMVPGLAGRAEAQKRRAAKGIGGTTDV